MKGEKIKRVKAKVEFSEEWTGLDWSDGVEWKGAEWRGVVGWE
jgi:hypothetical protein